MSKIAKILILITSLSLGLVVYVIISSKLVVMEKETLDNQSVGESVVKKEPVDLVLLAKEYKLESKSIMTDLDLLATSYASTSSAPIDELGTSSEAVNSDSEIKASMLKTRAMDLVVPTEYKDLHIKMVLAISRFDEYSKTHLQEDLFEGTELVNEIKTENIWAE